MINKEFLKLINERKSIRNFETNKPLTEEQISEINNAFKTSPNWINGQQVSVILVSDQNKKEELAHLAGGQEHIAKSSAFAVVLIDYYKIKQSMKVVEMEDIPEITDNINSFMVGLHDAGLVGTSILYAIEAMGLNSVVVGGIRQNIIDVKELLNLPKNTYPVFGISIGYGIDVKKQIKPARLPREADFFIDEYNQNSITKQMIEEFDKLQLNLQGKKWSSGVYNYWKNREEVSSKIKEIVKKSGFDI